MHAEQIGASVACLPEMNLAEAVDHLLGLGVGAVEILGFENSRHSQGLLPGLWFHSAPQDRLERLRGQLARATHVSIHAPFMNHPLICTDPEIAAVARQRARESIDACAFLGGTVCVVHITPKPGFAWDDCRGEAREALRELAHYSAERNVRVGVETGFPPSVREFCDFIHFLDHAHLGCTLDIGHLRSAMDPRLLGTPEAAGVYNANLDAICRDLGDRLFSLHLHNVRASDWRDHRGLESGLIDVPRLFGNLREIGFGGPAVLELEEPDVQPALLRSLACARQAVDTLR